MIPAVLISMLLLSDTQKAQLHDMSGRKRVFMIRHLVNAQVEGVVAHVEDTILFSGGWGSREYVYTFSLPDDSLVTGLRVRQGKGRWVKGRLLDARWVRKPVLDTTSLPARPDPAWMEQIGPSRYRLRLAPDRPGALMEVTFDYLQMLVLRWRQRVFTYPELGKDRRLTSATITVRDRPTPSGGAGKLYRRALPSNRSLELPIGPLPSREASRGSTSGASPPPARLFMEVERVRVGKKGASKRPATARPAGASTARARHAAGQRQTGSGVALVAVQGIGPSQPRQATNLLLLLDSSRSMWEKSFKHAGLILSALAAQLGRNTMIHATTFDRKVGVFSEKFISATPKNLNAVSRWLLSRKPANGSDLAAGFATALKAMKPVWGRRLIVLLTDGLLPEEFDPKGLVSTWPEGVELAVLVGRDGFEPVWSWDQGPLGRLARTVGGMSYGVDPARLKEQPGPPCPAESIWNPGSKPCAAGWNAVARRIAFPGQMTRISLTVDGKKITLPAPFQQIPSMSGFVHIFPFQGPIPSQVRLRFSRDGRWKSVVARRGRLTTHAEAARTSPPPADIKGTLSARPGAASIHARAGASGAAGSVGRLHRFIAARKLQKLHWLWSRESAQALPSVTRDPDTRARFSRAASAAYQKAMDLSESHGMLSWASSLVALDPSNAFSRDRMRFATRWGHRFFRRLAPSNSPNLPYRWPARFSNPRTSRVVVQPGRLTRSLMLRVLRQSYLKQARACYSKVIGLGASAENLPRGRCVLLMDIIRGEVLQAKLTKKEFRSATLIDCLVDAAYTLSVPRPKDDLTLYRVVYPMRFKPDQKAVEILGSASYRPMIPPSTDPLHGFD